MEKRNNRKTNITQKLGVGKGNFKKAIRDSLLLTTSDKDAYDVALKYFANKCAYCGLSSETIQLTADHIKPSNQGGRFIRGNIIPACQKCNSLRRDVSLEDFLNDKTMLTKIYEFQSEYLREDQSQSLEEELGDNGRIILKELDEALIIMRDVARTAIRANERNERVVLKGWVEDFRQICKKHNLI